MSKYDREYSKVLKRYNKVSWAELFDLDYSIIDFLIPRIEAYINNAFKFIENINNQKENLERLVALMKAIKNSDWIYEDKFTYLDSLIKHYKNKMPKLFKDEERWKGKENSRMSGILEYRCKEEFLYLLSKEFFGLWY